MRCGSLICILVFGQPCKGLPVFYIDKKERRVVAAFVMWGGLKLHVDVSA